MWARVCVGLCDDHHLQYQRLISPGKFHDIHVNKEYLYGNYLILLPETALI